MLGRLEQVLVERRRHLVAKTAGISPAETATSGSGFVADAPIVRHSAAPGVMMPLASRVAPLDATLLPEGVDPVLAWAERVQAAAAALVGSAGARLFVIAEHTGNHGGDMGQSLHERQGGARGRMQSDRDQGDGRHGLDLESPMGGWTSPLGP